jgi:hypothetical protein
VEAQVEALLVTIDENIPVNCRPCDPSKEIQSLKLGKACGFDGISNEYLRHLQRHLLYLTHLFDHCLRIGHFPAPCKEAKVANLPKTSKDPKFPKKIRPISLLSTTGKLFDNLVLRSIQEHTGERNVLNAGSLVFEQFKVGGWRITSA